MPKLNQIYNGFDNKIDNLRATLEKKLVIKKHEPIIIDGKKSDYYIDFKDTFFRYYYEFYDDLVSVVNNIIYKDLLNIKSYKKLFIVGHSISGIILATLIVCHNENLKKHSLVIDYFDQSIHPLIIREISTKKGFVQEIIGIDYVKKMVELFGNECLFVIIDDVINSGSSIRKTIEILKNNGIKKENILSAIVLFDVGDENINNIDGVNIIRIFEVICEEK